MSKITDQTLIVSAEDLAVADLDGEAVVLGPNSGRYYGLNEVGAHILKLAKQPKTVGDLLRVLQQEYEVEGGQLRQDVTAFLQSMRENQLIQIVGEEETVA